MCPHELVFWHDLIFFWTVHMISRGAVELKKANFILQWQHCRIKQFTTVLLWETHIVSCFLHLNKTHRRNACVDDLGFFLTSTLAQYC